MSRLFRDVCICQEGRQQVSCLHEAAVCWGWMRELDVGATVGAHSCVCTKRWRRQRLKGKSLTLIGGQATPLMIGCRKGEVVPAEPGCGGRFLQDTVFQQEHEADDLQEGVMLALVGCVAGS